MYSSLWSYYYSVGFFNEMELKGFVIIVFSIISVGWVVIMCMNVEYDLVNGLEGYREMDMNNVCGKGCDFVG